MSPHLQASVLGVDLNGQDFASDSPGLGSSAAGRRSSSCGASRPTECLFSDHRIHCSASRGGWARQL